MASPSVASRPGGFAGRTSELETLRGVLRAARDGRPGAVVVHGEAGVGKTRLVAEACRELSDDDTTVLWGGCMRFGAASTPYLPIIRALDDAPTSDLEGLLDRLRGATSGSGSLMREVDAQLDLVSRRAPLVLVVDDLQWADPTSLQVLGYLVAGFRRRQRLALLMTYRDEALEGGHALSSWLADVRRLPGISELSLHRLTLEEVEEQVSLLLGRPAPHQLVVDVAERSRGNAYFAELLVRSAPADAHALPAAVPEALRVALLARWHAMGDPARELSRVVAVAGRPVGYDLLRSVAPAAGVAPDTVDACIHEAVEAAVIQVDTASTLWFRHPLLAEVLDDSLLPGERRRLHRAFVEALLAQGRDAGETKAEALSDLSLHYDGAGLADDAFESALTAAESAAGVQAPAEEATLRLRAARLYPVTSAPVRARHPSHASLLAEAAAAAHRSGDVELAHKTAARATQAADEDAEPLLAARVLLMADLFAMDSGSAGERQMPVLRRAAALTAGLPPSEVAVLAEVALGETEFWLGHGEAARTHVDRALALADRLDDPGARSQAFSARALVVHDESGVAAAHECHRLALKSGNPLRIGEASIALANGLGELEGRLRETVEALMHGHRVAAEGGELAYSALLATYAANYLVLEGRLPEAREVVRVALASRAPGRVAIQARAVAMQLALRQGRVHEADDHRARIRELWPDYEHNPAWNGPPILAEYLLAREGPVAAMTMLADTVRRQSAVDQPVADLMLIWGARAAAEWVSRARLDGDPAAATSAYEALQRLEDARREFEPEPFEARDSNPVVRAAEATYVAHRSRLDEVHGAREAWATAAAAAEAAGTRWWHAEALVALARCHLLGRDTAAARPLLRLAHELCEQMEAEPLRLEVEALARSARVSLARPTASVPAPPADGWALAQLTARENEILGHLVAGHTYREIAEQLVISEKTVSVHVSNLLRKTGTSSRVEVSELARQAASEGAGLDI